MAGKKPLVVADIESRILLIRGQKVMLDAELAELYGVEIRALNQAVKRNVERFPEDFMFQLTTEEYESLRSQFVTLKTGRGQHRKYQPNVFTEHGALMLGNMLKSERAIEISVHMEARREEEAFAKSRARFRNSSRRCRSAGMTSKFRRSRHRAHRNRHNRFMPIAEYQFAT